MYNYFAALIYVTQSEHEAVMRMYPWQEKRFDDDEQLYYISTIITSDGKERLICAAQQDEMGMTASATLSMKLIQHFRPCYLIMPGIAAGTGSIKSDDSQFYGDVLLADAVWNYSNGKYVEPEMADIRFGNVGFLPRPTLVETDAKILPLLEKAINHPKNECHVHIGRIASGSAIVANSAIVEKQIHTQFRTTQGLEMESYGVAYAATHALKPRPHAIITKSICDFADNRKDDNYQKFAAHTSCEFVKFLCEKILPFEE